MKRVLLTSIALLAGAALALGTQQESKPIDASKKKVERPLKKKIRDRGKEMVEADIKSSIIAEIKKLEKPRFDVGKRAVELPIKKSLKLVEPGTVAPGKVNWHASFEKAKAAAKKSGKPVLLFHMIGKLTEEFC